MQKQEIELAIVGKGEYRIRDKFQQLNVSPEKWNKMNEKQKEIAMEKIHSVTFQESVSNVAFLHWVVRSKRTKGCTGVNLSKAVTFGMPKGRGKKGEKAPRKKGKDRNPTVSTIVPRIISSQNSPRLDVEEIFPSSCRDQQSSTNQQIVSTSRSVDPFKPLHTPMSLHQPVSLQQTPALQFQGTTQAASFQSQTLLQQRPSSSQQQPVSLQHTSALQLQGTSQTAFFQSQTLIRQRPTSSQQQPVSSQHTPALQLQGTSQTASFQSQTLIQQRPTSSQQQPVSSQHIPALQLQGTSQTASFQSQMLSQQRPTLSQHQPVSSQHTPALQFQGTSQTASESPALLQQRPTSSQQPRTTLLQLPPAGHQNPVRFPQPEYPSFPSPNCGQFLLYLLKFCPRQTSMCFGCGQPLKDGTQIRTAPNDMVIVSKMEREFSYNGTPQSKLANVYFHCNIKCVRRKQPNFQASSCIILPSLMPHLLNVHLHNLRNILGQ